MFKYKRSFHYNLITIHLVIAYAHGLHYKHDTRLTKNKNLVNIKKRHEYIGYIISISKGVMIFYVYVDDILLTRNDESRIYTIEAYLSQHFMIEDLQTLLYFLGIEIAYWLGKLVLS